MRNDASPLAVMTTRPLPEVAGGVAVGTIGEAAGVAAPVAAGAALVVAGASGVAAGAGSVVAVSTGGAAVATTVGCAGFDAPSNAPALHATTAAITARQDNTASDLDGFMTNNFLIMPAQKRGTLA